MTACNGGLNEGVKLPKYRVGKATYKVEIEDGWIVLDIGSGHDPHPGAKTLVDRELGTSIHLPQLLP